MAIETVYFTKYDGINLVSFNLDAWILIYIDIIWDLKFQTKPKVMNNTH